MQTENNTLIDDLLRRTEKSTAKVKQFEALTIDQLNQKKGNEWSILECLEHLNLYGDFYLVEIEKRIISGKNVSGSATFKSGLLGNYFANLMEVKNGKMSKMKSPKDKDPSNTALSVTTITRFLKQQERLTALLNQCRTIDLTRTKAAISLTKLVKLRLGDTLRFYTYHIERHVMQAERVMAQQNLKVLERSV